MDRISFTNHLNYHGWVVIREFVPQKLILDMQADLQRCYVICRNLQIKNDIGSTEGTLHHLIGQKQSFMDYLSLFEDLNEQVESYFGGKYILNSFGGNILKSGSSYANNIHRDIRSFSGELPLMLNTLVMLDDFTEENGATWLMDQGHECKEKPTQEEFDEVKFQITGKAGDIAFWNSNLWHCAGENKTDKPRRSVTPIFTKSFVKPGFDYPRALGYDYGHAYSPYLRQVLGYNSRIPYTLEEWYQPKEKRFYRADQE